jgi:hypothetical protein
MSVTILFKNPRPALPVREPLDDLAHDLAAESAAVSAVSAAVSAVSAAVSAEMCTPLAPRRAALFLQRLEAGQ